MPATITNEAIRASFPEILNRFVKPLDEATSEANPAPEPVSAD